jgi:hypothetical protein
MKSQIIENVTCNHYAFFNTSLIFLTTIISVFEGLFDDEIDPKVKIHGLSIIDFWKR